MTGPDLAELGLTRQQTSMLPAERVHMLAATLDVEFEPAGSLPLLWHWIYFNPLAMTSELGWDGHPRRESSLLTRFPRRMWVGGAIHAEGALQIDGACMRRTRLLSHERKRGTTGDMLLVSLEHTIWQADRRLIVERQDLIYREATSPTAPVGPAVEVPPGEGWRETVVPSSMLLFRFSAITFNSHRIHYDSRYATECEHYPGLVVQAPLTAMLMAESASRRLTKPLRSFVFRASSPLFVDQPICIDGVPDLAAHAQNAGLSATRSDGVVAMQATAGTRETC